MNFFLRILPLIFIASTSSAHETPHVHYHLDDSNWMPLAAGLHGAANEPR